MRKAKKKAKQPRPKLVSTTLSKEMRAVVQGIPETTISLAWDVWTQTHSYDKVAQEAGLDVEVAKAAVLYRIKNMSAARPVLRREPEARVGRIPYGPGKGQFWGEGSHAIAEDFDDEDGYP
ncbi:MAG: hypothetical protein M0Z41_13900 [Peptococcaceae bacterium]|jgi:hypothetical protein|nr:hypothetical protein [Peptococcaceae bacterium]